MLTRVPEYRGPRLPQEPGRPSPEASPGAKGKSNNAAVGAGANALPLELTGCGDGREVPSGSEGRGRTSWTGSAAEKICL